MNWFGTAWRVEFLGASALAVLLGLAPYVLAQGESVPSGLADAERLFEQKHYREAVASCLTIEKESVEPEVQFAARLLEAKSLVNLKDFAASEKVLERYVLAMPRSAEALYLLGYVLQRENKARESLMIYNRAASIKPPLPDDLKQVALDYVLLEDYPDAIQWLNRCIAADQTNAEAWYFLGRAWMQVGDFKEAERSFRQSIRLNPGDAKALDNLGLSLEAQNRNQEALQVYAQAVAIPVGQGSAPEQPLLDFGTLLNNENRSADALAYLVQAAALAPASVRCLEELSRAQVATGDLGGGLASMQRAVVIDAADPSVHFRLSQLYRKTGDRAKATAEARESIRLYGTHSTDTKNESVHRSSDFAIF